MNKTLTLSIVIPVYNEQRYLKACLDSIAKQTEPPDEVIVVDNNSTDKSVKIAESYKFVKVLHEKRQHQVFAQAAGFNAAASDILGRIDADSILPPDWVLKLKEYFASHDGVVGVTGGGEPYDVPIKWVGVAIFHGYMDLAGLIAGHRLLWGSNCAITRQGWRKIKAKVLMRPDIWEDYDLAFCLAKYGQIRYVPKITVAVSFRAMHTKFSRYTSYQFRSVRTYYLRTDPLRLSLFCLLWTTTFIIYPAAVFDDWLLKRREPKSKPASRV